MAALASSRQHPAPVQQLTPPSSSHGGEASWDFAVPLENSATNAEQEPYMSQYATLTHAPRQSHTSQATGFAKPVRSPTWSSQNQGFEDDRSYPMAERTNGLQQKPNAQMNAISNDPDSVMEYYNSQANNKRGPTAAAKGKPRKKSPQGGPVDPNSIACEHDENNWIHRDKLKEIETKELEAAGFTIGRASGSNSRSQSATRKPRDRRGSEVTGKNGDERADGRPLVSPIPAEEVDALEQDQGWSPTTFEELAWGGHPTSPRSNGHGGRPSTSRIPLPKTSGIPVPASVAERDALLPRPRAGSGNWNGDAIATNGARVRSGSISSQFLLDEPERDHETTPPYGHARKLSANSGSPPKSPQKSHVKAKTVGKPGPSSGARKTSIKVQAKNRQVSGATPPGKRPGTSGGTVSRPTTSHRPEGEAPWLATMYKPDPRLPPDQQIIPTHAKRMQQEQWENEGRVGSMYDRDFRLLNTEEIDGKRLSQLDPIEFERMREQARQQARENEAWPLPSSEKPASVKKPALGKLDTNVTKTLANEQPGYRLTPTIPQSPRIPSPKSAPSIAPATSQTKTTRVPEPMEEAKEKKGCCCISDGEDDTKSQVSEAAEVEVSADATGSKGQMSVLEALKGVLKLALIHDGLARGLREASKALDRREAHMCVLNEACEEEAYKKLVVALCSEHKIPLIKVPDGKQLGEWAGLCQIDREGNPRKVVNCSCVVVKDWGEESQERSILLNYFQTEQ
ncbi:hypothetical protein BDU57DRAFT_554453 [Ampelomyces quisqualis]|uniref:40S ribosomal protein S12 n=1 Tax=Ampelomyces quisqualis TaxID=50730 RepID=A0A6A5QX25_AMPQU|nr:hypothetical protein BDU57DRAFT_554453 [Ampelomyces quisqualis]